MKQDVFFDRQVPDVEGQKLAARYIAWRLLEVSWLNQYIEICDYTKRKELIPVLLVKIVTELNKKTPLNHSRVPIYKGL